MNLTFDLSAGQRAPHTTKAYCQSMVSNSYETNQIARLITVSHLLCLQPIGTFDSNYVKSEYSERAFFRLMIMNSDLIGS